MPRIARTVFAGIPHHITQRGNRGQDVFFTTNDRQMYLESLLKYSKEEGLKILAYCLMTNHILIISILLFFFSVPAYSLPVEDVEIINDRDYFPRVHQLFQDASHSIYVIMFSAHYYDRYPNSPSNILLRDLADAKKRGVDVKVILEQGKSVSGGWFGSKKIQPEQHQRVTQFLKQHGVPYVLDAPNTSTHAKLIVVDELYTVVGSTNWSYSAITKNFETAVVIKSRETAKSYIRYFKQLF